MKVIDGKTKHVQGLMVLLERIAACWRILTTRNVFVITITKEDSKKNRHAKMSVLCEEGINNPWNWVRSLANVKIQQENESRVIK